MVGSLSRMAKRELLAPIQEGYQGSSERDKVRILDEFIAVTGHHGKHYTRLPGPSGDGADHMCGVEGRCIYGEALRKAVTWCGKHRAASAGSA